MNIENSSWHDAVVKRRKEGEEDEVFEEEEEEEVEEKEEGDGGDEKMEEGIPEEAEPTSTALSEETLAQEEEDKMDAMIADWLK